MRGSGAFRTSAVPGGALAGPWVRNPLWRDARAVPSLDIDFANNKSLTDRVTSQNLVSFTRASSGSTFVGSDKVLRSAVTNYIRNNTMVGAVAGTPGTNPNLWQYVTTQSNGLTQTIVGVGTESGITYIDYRFNGTTVASASSIAFGFESAASAAVGQTWTSSIYLRLVGGTTTGISSFQLGLIENNSGGSFVGGALYTIATPTSASLDTQRYSATRTLSTATVAFCVPTMGINVANSTAIDFTLRIGMPQLELSSTVGNVIPTTSTINSAPRFDHNPTTGESLGLLVEEARTNSIRNNTGVGAVAGTPGTLPTNWNQSNNTGLAANVVGTGTENGITYIDLRVNGTTTGTGQTNIVLETALGIAATTGQTWSLSSYLKIQAGSLTNVGVVNLVLQENTAASTVVTAGAQAITIPTSSLGTYRPTFTRTLSGGVTVAAVMPYIQININTGLVVDFTLRIGLPQLEQGAFATSVILTDNTAVGGKTRAADVASITGSNFGVTRTNYIRNNTGVGAVAGTPGTLPTNWSLGGISGGLATQIVGTGTENNIAYIDIRIFGTNSSGSSVFPGVFFDTATGISATSGQVWAESLYLSLVAGTGITFDVAVHEADSGGAFLRSTTVAGGSSIPIAGNLNTLRRSGSLTLGASTAFARPLIAATVVNGASVNFTLRIGLPQFELGSVATAVIPTTTAAVSVFESSFYNQTEGTMFAEFGPYGNGGASTNAGIAQLDGGSSANSIRMFGGSTVSPVLDVTVSSTNQAYISAGALTPSTISKITAAYKVNDFARVFNGPNIGTDTSGTVPTVNQMLIANGSGGVGSLNGTIKRLTYWPVRLFNNILQTITQP